MLKAIHPIAGALALLTIAAFWLATVLSEVFASHATVTAVKLAIPWGFLLLMPALAATGGSGFAFAFPGGRRPKLVDAKVRRTRLIAGNGLLVLVPSALFLAARARSGDFDAAFQAVQGLELVAGAANIALLALNMRDGLRMKGRLRRRPTQSP